MQQQLNALLKASLIGLGFFLIFSTIGIRFSLSTGVAVLFFLISGWYFGGFRRDRQAAKQLLHLKYPDLEFSLAILDKKEKNLAEILQLKRLEVRYKESRVPVLIGKNIFPAAVFFVLSTGIFAMGNLIGPQTNSPSSDVEIKTKEALEKKSELPIVLSKIKLSISPPSYTGLGSKTQADLDIKGLEGSIIRWELNFSSNSLDRVLLSDAQGIEVPFQQKEDAFTLEDRLEGSGLYTIQGFSGDSMVFESTFHKLEAVRDKSPIIVPDEKELYLYHFTKDPMKRNLTARVADDFMVKQVHLVATLARGRGENVKFRENRIKLTDSDFKEKMVGYQMDLESMDFQPGDELYYYWLAIDNKRPEPNISKSDTYFIQYVDSTGLSDSQLESMAIHVLPDYFRSQRQIIIDTEKLLKEKGKISEREFQSQSNELGHEQKLLRMRYGQYLGEEFESSAPGGSLSSPEGRNILESFIHNHDHEGENEGAPALSKFRYAALQQYRENHDENQEMLKQQLEEISGNAHDHHDHDHDEDDELASLLEEYLHNHDSEEMNTLYEQSTRNLLKMALEQMWQSELHLRLFEPNLALPFQEKALEYLKTVQQKSRTYVKKSGFEPTPIKEAEKRLTGEDKDLDALYTKKMSISQSELPILASKVLGMTTGQDLSEDDKAVLDRFGQLWAFRIGESGLEDWDTLLLIQKLRQGSLSLIEMASLRKQLQAVLQMERRSRTNDFSNTRLAKSFWENYK
ncbi:hypothetical protein [Mongoliibacter sp.]|uniref:hypothetical protein n=1 Tax=Mongoliibacter sp. TaxID=2022438 RepID=UPI0025D29380|nr:hypothetical protein [Mongoliibacter sp.]